MSRIPDSLADMETFLDIDDPLDGELISDTRLDLTELVIESTELACRKELDIREDTRVLIVLRLVLEIRRVGRLGFGSSTRGIGDFPRSDGRPSVSLGPKWPTWTSLSLSRLSPVCDGACSSGRFGFTCILEYHDPSWGLEM